MQQMPETLIQLGKLIQLGEHLESIDINQADAAWNKLVEGEQPDEYEILAITLLLYYVDLYKK